MLIVNVVLLLIIVYMINYNVIVNNFIHIFFYVKLLHVCTPICKAVFDLDSSHLENKLFDYNKLL